MGGGGPIELNSNGIGNKLCQCTHKTWNEPRQKTIEKKMFFPFLFNVFCVVMAATRAGHIFFSKFLSFSCRNWCYCKSRTFNFISGFEGELFLLSIDPIQLGKLTINFIDHNDENEIWQN